MKAFSHWTKKDSTFIKNILIINIAILLPIAMFFAGFGWYDSWEVHKFHNPLILNNPLYFEHGIVIGASALTFSLLIILLLVIVDLMFNQLSHYWQVAFVWSIVAFFTMALLASEFFSAVLSSYFLTPWLIITMILLPVIYSGIIFFILINQQAMHHKIN